MKLFNVKSIAKAQMSKHCGILVPKSQNTNLQETEVTFI